MSDNFFPFAVQHVKATYTYLDDVVTSDGFSSGAVNVSFSHTANSVSTIKAFYGLGTSVSPLSLIAPENYVETTSELTFHEPAAKAGKVQYHYNAYTQITETIDVTGLNLTLSHPPVAGYPIAITSEDDETTYINGTDYNINALNSRIIELIPGGNIVQRTNTNYYYTMNGDGSSQFGTGGGGGGVAAVPDTYYDENDLPESIFVEYDTVTPVEDETGNATTVEEITSYTVSAFASGIDFRLVSVDELIVDGRTLAINEFSFNEKTGVVTLRETPTSLAIQISYTWRRHYSLVSLSLDSAGTGNLTVPSSLVSTIKYPTVKTLETGGDTLLQYQDYVIEENLSSGIHKLVLLTDAIDGQVVVSEDGVAVYQTPVKLINQDNFNYDKLEDHHIVYRDGQLAISEEDPSRYVEYRDYDNEEYNSEWVSRMTGSGTEGDPYLIYTPYDFIVEAHSLTPNNKFFKLMNNLDFEPILGVKISTVDGSIIAEEIDTSAPYYNLNGLSSMWTSQCIINFDGNNKILKNIYSYRDDWDSRLAGSIFTSDKLGGVIKNLTIYNSYKYVYNHDSIGFIFNWSDNTNIGLEINNVHIYNCKICKNSTGTGALERVGAIGGATNKNLRLVNCSVLNSEIVTGRHDAATFIGGKDVANPVQFINCYSNSIVRSNATGNDNTDRINGLFSTDDASMLTNSRFINCYFAGQIIYNTLTGGSSSGWPIVGHTGTMTDYESSFINCYSKSGNGKVQPYVTVKSEAEMKQPLFVNLLNAELEEPAYVYNPGGYPKLLDEKIHPLSSNYRIPVLGSNGSILYSTPYKLADLEKIPSISLAWKNYIEEKLDNISSPHALTYYTEASLPQMIHAIADWTESVTNETGTLDQDGWNYILAANSILSMWSPVVHDVHNVLIDNVELDSDQWGFNETTKTITLYEAKPNATISVSYSVDIHMDRSNVSIVQSGNDIGIGYIGYVSYPTNGTIVRSYSSVVVKDLNTDDQLIEKQDYIINYSYDQPASFGIKLLLDTPYAGQIAVVSENNSSSVWLKPSLVVKNPYNIENLDDHPIVYKDSELVYRAEKFASYPNNAAYYANIPFPESILVDMECTIDATESGTVTTVDNVSTYIVTGYTKTDTHRMDWKLLSVSNLRVANQYVEYTFTENGTITLNESVADGTAISLSYKYFWSVGNYRHLVDADTGIVQLGTSSSIYMPTTVNKISLDNIMCQTTDYHALIRNIDYTIDDIGTKQLKLLKTSIPNQIEAIGSETNTDIKLSTVKQVINGYAPISNSSFNGKSIVIKNDELVYSNEACNNPEPHAYATIDPKSNFRLNLEYDLLADIVNENVGTWEKSSDSLSWTPRICGSYGATIVKINKLYIDEVDVLNDDTYNITIDDTRKTINIIKSNWNLSNDFTITADLEIIIHYPKQTVAVASYRYRIPNPNYLDPDYGTSTEMTVQKIFNTICTTMSGKLLEIDQDYITTRYSDYIFDITFVRTSLPGQILTRTENGSTWLKPSLIVSNPDNIEDLNNHPVVYKDGHLQYGSLPTATDTDLGLVQVGSNINVSNGEISVPTATDSTKGVIAYDSNLFKTDTNDKLSLNTLFYKRSYRGVTASLAANGTEAVTIDFTNPNGYKLLTTEVKTNSSLCNYSWTQTAMVQDYSSGAVQVSFRNLDNSSHTFNYLIDLIFIKTDLAYHEYNDTRS